MKDYDDWNSLINDTQIDWSYESCLKYFIMSENNTVPSLRSSPFHGFDGGLKVSSALNPYTVCQDAAKSFAKELSIPYNPDYNGASQEGGTTSQLTQYQGRRFSVSDGFIKPAILKHSEGEQGWTVSSY